MMAATKKADPRKPLCFVIGPIGRSGTDTRKAADWLLKHAIRPVLEDAEFGYEVKRADDDADPGLITNGVLRDTLTADLVIADLSAHNPNAFYELGVRHAASKPTIHVTSDTLEIPFDNKDQRTIGFDFSDFDSVEASKDRLRAMVRAVREEGFQVSNPVTQARGAMELRASIDPKDQVISDLQDRMERLESKQRTSNAAARVPTTPALGFGVFGHSPGSPSALTGLLESAALSEEAAKASLMARLAEGNLFGMNGQALAAEIESMKRHAVGQAPNTPQLRPPILND